MPPTPDRAECSGARDSSGASSPGSPAPTSPADPTRRRVPQSNPARRSLPPTLATSRRLSVVELADGLAASGVRTVPKRRSTAEMTETQRQAALYVALQEESWRRRRETQAIELSLKRTSSDTAVPTVAPSMRYACPTECVHTRMRPAEHLISTIADLEWQPGRLGGRELNNASSEGLYVDACARREMVHKAFHTRKLPVRGTGKPEPDPPPSAVVDSQRQPGEGPVNNAAAKALYAEACRRRDCAAGRSSVLENKSEERPWFDRTVDALEARRLPLGYLYPLSRDGRAVLQELMRRRRERERLGTESTVPRVEQAQMDEFVKELKKAYEALWREADRPAREARRAKRERRRRRARKEEDLDADLKEELDRVRSLWLDGLQKLLWDCECMALGTESGISPEDLAQVVESGKELGKAEAGLWREAERRAREERRAERERRQRHALDEAEGAEKAELGAPSPLLSKKRITASRGFVPFTDTELFPPRARITITCHNPITSRPEIEILRLMLAASVRDVASDPLDEAYVPQSESESESESDSVSEDESEDGARSSKSPAASPQTSRLNTHINHAFTTLLKRAAQRDPELSAAGLKVSFPPWREAVFPSPRGGCTLSPAVTRRPEWQDYRSPWAVPVEMAVRAMDGEDGRREVVEAEAQDGDASAEKGDVSVPVAASLDPEPGTVSQLDQNSIPEPKIDLRLHLNSNPKPKPRPKPWFRLCCTNDDAIEFDVPQQWREKRMEKGRAPSVVESTTTTVVSRGVEHAKDKDNVEDKQKNWE